MPVVPAAAHRAYRVLALALVALTTVLLVGPIAAASADPLTGVDLSRYVRVGRHNLPEPTRTTAPAGSLLAQEASSVTYDWDTDTLFVVGDGGTSVVQVSKAGALINSMTLASGSSPQGTEFYDTEGIAYLGGGQFAITEERYRQVNRFTYVAGATLQRSDVQTVKLGTTVGNVGLEGIGNDPQTGGYLLVKETDPESIFSTQINWAAGTATNGSPTASGSTDLFNPALAGLSDFSDVFALANLSTLTGPDTTNLLIISQQSGRVVEVNRSGTVLSSLTIVGDADNPLSVPDQTDEGVTMDNDGNLYIVNEQGGGDSAHPQLWVYQPSTATNVAPTAVALTHQLASIPENANTTARTKVADVAVTDDGLGTNNLSVTGADASAFDVDSTGLYLKAGTTLNRATKSSYTVSVAVDDPGVGATPDATSSAYTLTVTAASSGSGTASVVVSEVSPWSSGDSPYAADWFELTNTGYTTINLSNWRMDDNSNSYASAVVLNGVTSLAPGKSAIFLEGDSDTAAEFANSWFGTAAPPGLLVGYYSGAGVGLSTGGDAINVFDGLGARVAGVTFGASTTGRTFDNSGQQAAVTALSTVGVNGAFTSPDGEIGSPGTTGIVPAPPSVAVTEVSPWSSGNMVPPRGYAADWFELTNTGSTPIELSGWKMDDNSNAFASAVPMVGVSTLAPGESAVFTEGTAATASALASEWYGLNVPFGLQVGSYTGSGVGLSTGGDAVNVFDAAGNRVTGVAFGTFTQDRTFDNAAGAGSTTLPLPVIATLSSAGVNGAFTTTHGEIGSPGRIANLPPLPPLVVTEVSPWGSGNAASHGYAADWFELTNTGATSVDLTGWKMDDNSNAFGSAVPLVGVATLAPGESVVFVEGTAATATAFASAWFASHVPSGFQVGSYTGSGVGLSTGGDAINVFNATGRRVTGVAFGSSTTDKTFDNAAGIGSGLLPLPTISTLSAVGANGAYAGAGGETGSPGLKQADVTAPTISFGGNAGTYITNQQVHITCAVDDPRGSGVASTTCADVNGLAGTYGLGSHTVTATATDHAGNVRSAAVTFMVLALPDATPPPPPPSPDPAPTPSTAPSAGSGSLPPASNAPSTSDEPPAPKASLTSDARAAELAKGVTTTLKNLEPRSKITVTILVGDKKLTTIKGTADKAGKGDVKLKLTKKQLAGLKGKKLTVTYTVVDADGERHTLTDTIEVA